MSQLVADAEGIRREVRFFVPGMPVTKGSWRPMHNRHTGKTFLIHDKPAAFGSWVGTVRQFAQAAGVTLHDGPVTISLTFFLPRPQSHFGKRKGLAVLKKSAPKVPAKKPDGDKLERCIWDALTGLAYIDDAQIVAWSGRKEFGAPGVEVTIDHGTGG